VATRFGAGLVDALNMITMLLPGTPTTYNGEELGMEDTDVSWEQTKDTAGITVGPEKYKLFSRDPERSPMQWNAGINAGLCKPRLYIEQITKDYVSLQQLSN